MVMEQLWYFLSFGVLFHMIFQYYKEEHTKAINFRIPVLPQFYYTAGGEESKVSATYSTVKQSRPNI